MELGRQQGSGWRAIPSRPLGGMPGAAARVSVRHGSALLATDAPDLTPVEGMWANPTALRWPTWCPILSRSHRRHPRRHRAHPTQPEPGLRVRPRLWTERVVALPSNSANVFGPRRAWRRSGSQLGLQGGLRRAHLGRPHHRRAPRPVPVPAGGQGHLPVPGPAPSSCATAFSPSACSLVAWRCWRRPSSASRALDPPIDDPSPVDGAAPLRPAISPIRAAWPPGTLLGGRRPRPRPRRWSTTTGRRR
jgi:hypothetical protein